MLHRKFLRRGLASLVMAVGLAFGAAPSWAEEIRVLNWQGYGTDEAWSLELFKEKTGIDVVHDLDLEKMIATAQRSALGGAALVCAIGDVSGLGAGQFAPGLGGRDVGRPAQAAADDV